VYDPIMRVWDMCICIPLERCVGVARYLIRWLSLCGQQPGIIMLTGRWWLLMSV